MQSCAFLHSILLRAARNENKCVTFQYILECQLRVCGWVSVYECNFWFMFINILPLALHLTFVRNTWKYFKCPLNQKTTSDRASQQLASPFAIYTHTHTHTEWMWRGKKARKRNDLFAHFSHFYIFDCWAAAFNTFFSFRHIWRSMHDKLLRKLSSSGPLLHMCLLPPACLSSKCTQEIPQITRRQLHFCICLYELPTGFTEPHVYACVSVYLELGQGYMLVISI